MENVFGYEFPPGIVGDYAKDIKLRIVQQMNQTDLLIDSFALKEITPELKKFLQQPRRRSRLFLWSGPDWDYTYWHKPVSQYIDKFNPYHIGNSSDDEYYFSFWLSWVRTHLDSFTNFDCFNISDSPKIFMNLNRKPHQHRINLVSKLYLNNLQNDGYISLGYDKNVDIDYLDLPVPITLNNDITNIEGDKNVYGDAGGITNDISSLGCPDKWNDHFLNIVSETTCGSQDKGVFISEKTFKPIIGKRPFMVLGDYNLYKKLHDWGIDTFDDILGDGYKEKSPLDRVEWIINTVKELKSHKNLPILLYKLKPRLDNNFKVLMEVALDNELKLDSLI